MILLGLLILSDSPLRAESYFDGQPFFGVSGMLAAARDTRIDSGTGAAVPALVPDSEIVTQTGYGISAYGGWLFDSNWRLGLELSHRSVGLDQVTASSGASPLTGNLTLNAAFINLAREFRGPSFVTPYLGIGAGAAHHSLEIETLNFNPGPPELTAVSPAFQAMVGINLETSEDVDLVVGYRYVNLYRPDYSEFTSDFMEFHNFEVGFKLYPEDW
ncbi:MAG: outer membrane beta-barrel protein [Nitrospinaceae bacterium]|nr:porin family protein [Nitrospinaceae bacterium]NIR53498.1 porin family protein [Nitrospinaceae bacterium]NIS83897.1 porin family protein [Nitrospinaceae bacterium]NIT80699.1 porin family protein [Nitrospinaceae bacterium]NIU43014.1 porin family protein [Nitrospinaceae bacterium]